MEYESIILIVYCFIANTDVHQNLDGFAHEHFNIYDYMRCTTTVACNVIKNYSVKILLKRKLFHDLTCQNLSEFCFLRILAEAI